jgi:hypothetical protein
MVEAENFSDHLRIIEIKESFRKAILLDANIDFYAPRNKILLHSAKI